MLGSDDTVRWERKSPCFPLAHCRKVCAGQEEQKDQGSVWRSDRGQHSLEGLAIPEGTQEAIHQYGLKKWVLTEEVLVLCTHVVSFLPEDACGMGS